MRAPQYNWTINDVELEEDTEDLKFNRSTGELTIVGATKFDEGTYRCSAYNKAGSETTNVVVIIHIVATIVDQVLAVSVGLGGTAVLTCTLSASPPINTIQWIVSNTDPVVNSTKYRFYYNGRFVFTIDLSLPTLSRKTMDRHSPSPLHIHILLQLFAFQVP